MDDPQDLTWDEFLALPYETRNAALIDGKVVVNSPNALHELIVRNLSFVFTLWLRQQGGIGDVSTQQPVKINDRRGYQPDFAWYPPEHCAPRGEPPSFSGLPELIVEVLSPSTKSFDLIRKRVDYEKVGISEVWFVDPVNQVVLVCQRSTPEGPFVDIARGIDETLTSPRLPGFEVRVSDLFDP